MSNQPRPTRRPLQAPLSGAELRRQNCIFGNSGGVSAANREQGFVPAFLDRDTGAVYRARYRDGTLAPMHILDGLPGSLVVSRDFQGRATQLKESVEAGFLRGGRFFTRSEAVRAVA